MWNLEMVYMGPMQSESGDLGDDYYMYTDDDYYSDYEHYQGGYFYSYSPADADWVYAVAPALDECYFVEGEAFQYIDMVEEGCWFY